MTIRDDGKGMDEETMRRQQPSGHFGMPGMRERAAIVRDDSRSAARSVQARRSSCGFRARSRIARPRGGPGGCGYSGLTRCWAHSCSLRRSSFPALIFAAPATDIRVSTSADRDGSAAPVRSPDARQNLSLLILAPTPTNS